MEGRPATRMKSDGWSPEVSLSSLSNPVARPVTCSFRSYSRSIYSKVSLRMVRTWTAVPCMRRSESWKICVSAWSRRLSTSSLAS